MARRTAEARLGLVDAESEATGDAVADDAEGRGLGRGRVAGFGHAEPSRLFVVVPAEADGGELRLMPPERIFVTETGRFLLLAAGRAGSSGRRKIELADWDGDGNLDLITDSDEGPVWYENVGSQAKPVMKARGTVVRAKLAGHNPTPNVADWNGDGRLDVLVGGEDGFFYFFDRRYIEGLK